MRAEAKAEAQENALQAIEVLGVSVSVLTPEGRHASKLPLNLDPYVAAERTKLPLLLVPHSGKLR